MQLLMAARYIVRNPLEANIVENAGQWSWSSYRATVGKITPPGYLFVDDVLSCLSNNRQKAQLFYEELVHMDLKENDDQIITLFQKVNVEDRDPVFQKRIRTVMDMKNSPGPVFRGQRILSRPDLQELFNGIEQGDLYTRNRIISDAFKLYAYTQSEIADFLGLSSSAISKVICKSY